MWQTNSECGFLGMCIENFLTLIGLNLIFLCFCVPVFTIPAAVAGLTAASQKILLREGGCFHSFLRGFVKNFWESIPLGLVYIAGSALLLYAAAFYFRASEGKGIAIALSMFSVACVYLLFCMGSYAFQMLVRVQLKTTAIIKNAFSMIFLYSRVTVSTLLFAFLLIAVPIWLLPRSLPWLLLLGASLPCLTAGKDTFLIVNDSIVK